MGYQGVELAGLYGHKPESIRDWLKEIGLIPISAHVPYAELRDELEKTVQAYKTIGCSYIAIPYLPEDERYGTDSYDEFLSSIPKISEVCKSHGIVLLYHNHDFEFQKDREGSYILDALYSQFPADILQAEIDTCWVKVSKVDPISYIKQYAGRCPIVHLKDYTGAEPVEFTALGKGIQDIQGIATASIQAGAKWVIVEQDDHTIHTPMEDVRLSIDYLKEMNW
ncbi:MAG TPA: sugar phosphate isomerase/epimerase [Candidatus Merdenecus merdavium]|nr:sugar phosphate isomerase/epimerase [Candidatus Merdenecus merdavium]